MNKADIIDHHDLSFDPGDSKNGSLYLGFALGANAEDSHEEIVTLLRAASLWSNETLKRVPDEQREAYKEQLKFIELAEFELRGVSFFIARFDHEKFPSDANRFVQWKQAIEQHLKTS